MYFPYLETWRFKFPAFPVPWQPWRLVKSTYQIRSKADFGGYFGFTLDFVSCICGRGFLNGGYWRCDFTGVQILIILDQIILLLVKFPVKKGQIEILRLENKNRFATG